MQQRCLTEGIGMRVVTIEEHYSVPELARRVDQETITRRGYGPRTPPKSGPSPLALLPDLGDARLKAMDEAGVTVQVLSNSGPGPELLSGQAGIDMARGLNDHVAAAIARHPDRFDGFAALPLQSPDAAAAELKRAVKDLHLVGAMVNGTTDGRFLDHPSYDGILAVAAELDVPIYIHPHIPPAAVRKAYFSELPTGAARVLETAGWGWHSETAVHVLRMVVAGTFDRHPRLKVIIGHMGEMLPMMLARAEKVFAADIDHLKRSVPRTILDQVWITTSGIFDEPSFLVALLTFGIDRIMFSIDYPYSANALGREFLDRISLAPADMAKLTHSNADALLKLKVPAK
jgi:predicted TIM-barrel fold metal-dependent hydrolase